MSFLLVECACISAAIANIFVRHFVCIKIFQDIFAWQVPLKEIHENGHKQVPVLELHIVLLVLASALVSVYGRFFTAFFSL